ncbi:MAG: lipoprotein insertase outer membrane protein LolB [Methylococcales bacterium]|nr:lipoprotein insertase outer membrane protein LolB [Methylococcales bacterium]
MIKNEVLAILFFSVFALNACSVLPEKQPLEAYPLAQMQHLQKQDNWYFEGRLALANEKDSISAAITWRHQPAKDNIELVGPLAQGRVVIEVTPGRVMVDDGDNPREYQGEVDEIVSRQLGVEMPVDALRFWVLGVNDPGWPVVEQGGGFDQEGWRIRFKEMQQVQAERLPKKLSAEKDKTKIKLIVDQWELS